MKGMFDWFCLKRQKSQLIMTSTVGTAGPNPEQNFLKFSKSFKNLAGPEEFLATERI